MHHTITQSWVLQHLPPRPADSHKGSFGTLTVIAGSAFYRGAAALAVSAALRAGTGVVRLASIKEVCAAVACQLPCCTLYPLKASEDKLYIDAANAEHLTKLQHTALLVGPGMANSRHCATIVLHLLQNAKAPLVLDADALNVLAGHMDYGEDLKIRAQLLDALQQCNVPVIITPHSKEMARLTGSEVHTVIKNAPETAANFAKTYRCTVVLKNSTTLIATKQGELFANDNGKNSGLAKGGSGDVLAGIIAGLVAQQTPPYIAAAAGVWLHAQAGWVGVSQYGVTGLSPADLPLCLCSVWSSLHR